MFVAGEPSRCSNHTRNIGQSFLSQAVVPQPIVPAESLSLARDLCATCDRSSVPALSEYDECCLTELRVAAGKICEIEFDVYQIAPRRGSATRGPSVDYRSSFIWSFVDIWTVKGGISGVARIISINKDTLRRYWNNANNKGSCLTRDAVVAAETVIIDYLIRSASIDTEMNTVMPPNSPNSGHRVQPIHIQMSGAGDLAVMAVGERQDEWVFKAQRSDAEVHLRRGFRCRKTFKRQAGPVLQGRCFEWVIVEDSSPLRPGLPKFVMHKLSLDENIGTLTLAL